MLLVRQSSAVTISFSTRSVSLCSDGGGRGLFGAPICNGWWGRRHAAAGESVASGKNKGLKTQKWRDREWEGDSQWVRKRWREERAKVGIGFTVKRWRELREERERVGWGFSRSESSNFRSLGHGLGEGGDWRVFYSSRKAKNIERGFWKLKSLLC